MGAGFTALTVAAGVVAYNSVAHDTPSHEAMTEHRNWALVTAALFIALAVWSWLRARAGQGMNSVLLIALLAGGGLLASTAWLGGEAVYRYGLGVMSLPKTDTHDHDHAAGGHGDAGSNASSDADSGGDDHHSLTQADSHAHKPKPVSTLYENDSDNRELPEKFSHDNIDGHHDEKKVGSHNNDDGHHDKPVHDNSDGHHDKKKMVDHHDDGHAH